MLGALGAGDAEAGGREDASLLPGSRKRQQACREQAQYGGHAESRRSMAEVQSTVRRVQGAAGLLWMT